MRWVTGFEHISRCFIVVVSINFHVQNLLILFDKQQLSDVLKLKYLLEYIARKILLVLYTDSTHDLQMFCLFFLDVRLLYNILSSSNLIMNYFSFIKCRYSSQDMILTIPVNQLKCDILLCMFNARIISVVLLQFILVYKDITNKHPSDDRNSFKHCVVP